MKRLIFFITLFISSNIYSQNYIVDWQQCYGGTGVETPYSMVETETGVLMCGYINSEDANATNYHGSGDAWVLSLDHKGKIIWEKCYGGSAGANALGIFKAIGQDAYYVFGKSSSSDGDVSNHPYPGVSSLWVIKIDLSGNILWDQILGYGAPFPYHHYGCPTKDGGFICGGNIAWSGGDVSQAFGYYDAWYIKLDSNGATEWDKTIGTEYGAEQFAMIKELSDGSYIASSCGAPMEGGSGNVKCISSTPLDYDAILFKLDSLGNKIWERCYGGTGNESIEHMIETESGYLFMGWTNSRDGDLQDSGYHGQDDIWLLETDFDGNIIRSKCYGGTRNDLPGYFNRDSDNNIYVVGQTNSDNGDVSGNHLIGNMTLDVWVAKIDENRNVVSQKCFGGAFREWILFSAVYHGADRFTIAAEFIVGDNGDIACTENSIYSDIWVFGVYDSLTSSVSQINKPKFEVFPNPANHQLTIKLPEDYNFTSVSNNSQNKIHMINSLGEVIGEFPINKQVNISTTGYPSGLYFLQCVIGDALITDKVLILHE